MASEKLEQVLWMNETIIPMGERIFQIIFIFLIIRFIWKLFTNKKSTETGNKNLEKKLTSEEYKNRLKEILTKWQNQMDSKGHYNGNPNIKKWEEEVKQIANDYINDSEYYNPVKFKNSINRLEKIIRSGMDRIKWGRSPYDDIILSDPETKKEVKQHLSWVGFLIFAILGFLFFMICSVFGSKGGFIFIAVLWAIGILFAYSCSCRIIKSHQNTENKTKKKIKEL